MNPDSGHFPGTNLNFSLINCTIITNITHMNPAASCCSTNPQTSIYCFCQNHHLQLIFSLLTLIYSSPPQRISASGPPNTGWWLQEDCPQSTEDSVLQTVICSLDYILLFKSTPFSINHEFHKQSSASSYNSNSVSLISKQQKETGP